MSKFAIAGICFALTFVVALVGFYVNGKFGRSGNFTIVGWTLSLMSALLIAAAVMLAWAIMNWLMR